MNKPVNIEHILPFVRKPGRYIGGELHSVQKGWEDEQVHFCLVFPDLYEIGMSHQGLQILYHILNRREDSLAHRCYVPDLDMENELRRKGLSLFSLEARLPLGEYDVIGITLPYELCYTNILSVLDLADIPFYASERDGAHPLVIAGGAGAFNPEPVADFFDAVVLGDGEEVVEELAALLHRCKQEGCSREEKLRRLAAVQGVYVPSYFQPQYFDDGRIRAMEPLHEKYTGVMRRVLPEMHPPELMAEPLVPVVKPVHDRLGVEIARGCTRGCRFCQAGIIYRPVRERSIDEIMQLAEKGIDGSGFDELALLSLSTGDYSCLDTLMTELMDRFADEYVSVSMPSMRVGTLTPTVMDQIKRVRKTGFTVAPEAGTDRLREVINKGITEEDLLTTCRDAFSLGWNLIKFYFMIGLPTETADDVRAIADLAVKARREADPDKLKQVKINVSVGTFVPKPHTPFQWEQQLTLEQSKQKIEELKGLLPRKGFALKWHDPQQSYLEGVFSRGDRRLSRVIVKAWQDGARLDGWSEHFNLERWHRAAEESSLDLDYYLSGRDFQDILPWDHLESGVERSFLENEYHRAMEQQYTEDCRVHGCKLCGLCDFKTLKPLVSEPRENRPAAQGPTREKDQDNQPSFIYKVDYSRLGDSRFYGHLEILQLIFRVLHRVGVPLLFSRGFNPSPKVSFSPALPLGMESRAEYFYMELAKPLQDLAEIVNRLNDNLPATIRVGRVTLEKRVEQVSFVASYRVRLPDLSREALKEKIETFLSQDKVVVERVRKRKRRQLDLRPLVKSITVEGDGFILNLYHHHGKAGTNPLEIMEHGLGFSREQALTAGVMKLSVTPF